ncbi:RNA polymerase sigma factor [Clostridium rhizosphaerae]|uniref:RNA polymerase sigma factor n=1 Tax=Clostridium rhizosphaerae TaxID=2803861 RepID=UPI00308431E2
MDIDLIAKAKEKDSQAFRVLFNTYKVKAYKTACMLLKDNQYAEDVVQEAFLQVYLKLNKLSNPAAFEKWLYKIVVNLCYDILRKKGKDKAASMDEAINLYGDFLIDNDDKPEDEVVKKELYKIVNEKIDLLPLKHRTVLILYYFNGFDIQHIAEIISTSQGTVKSRLFYARKVLKESLDCIKDDFIEDNGGSLYEY